MFTLPVFLIIVIIFVVWLRYESSKVNKASKAESESFWDKERKSHFVRKVDLNTLDYIQIPLDKLPFLNTDDEELIACQSKINDYAKARILNLTGITNTDLKLQYGAQNITFLSTYDHNFTLLARTLYTWGKRLYDLDYIKESKTVLEYGIECNTDVMNHYILLCKIYSQENNPDGIDSLINSANSINSLLKESIIKNLIKEKELLKGSTS